MRLLPFFLAVVCFAQTPRVGLIEVFGARKLSPVAIQQAAGVQQGDPLPPSKTLLEERIEELEGVADASVDAQCCTSNGVILYLGVLETGGEALAIHAEPTESVEIPEAVAGAYAKFLSEVREAGKSGGGSEDLTQGHSLLSAPGARAAQLAFIPLVKNNLTVLREALRTSNSPEARAIAAYVLGYYPDKSAIMGDLLYALHDPDDTVRANAIRSLTAIATLGARTKDKLLRVDPSPLISLLNSPVWTDRNNSAVALVTITESRDAQALRLLREHAGPALLEMARWNQLQNALPAFILLGRSANISEKDLQEAWANGERDALIARVSSKTK